MLSLVAYKSKHSKSNENSRVKPVVPLPVRIVVSRWHCVLDAVGVYVATCLADQALVERAQQLELDAPHEYPACMLDSAHLTETTGQYISYDTHDYIYSTSYKHHLVQYYPDKLHMPIHVDSRFLVELLYL